MKALRILTVFFLVLATLMLFAYLALGLALYSVGERQDKILVAFVLIFKLVFILFAIAINHKPGAIPWIPGYPRFNLNFSKSIALTLSLLALATGGTYFPIFAEKITELLKRPGIGQRK